MNPQLVEFALRKQRLVIHLEMQRADLVRRLDGIEPALDKIDRVRDGLRWTREKIPIIATSSLVLVVLKPKLVLRVAKRAWFGWALWRRFHGRAGPLLLLARRLRGKPPLR